MARPRLLSHSEIKTALTCWAQHAFAYTGHLTEGTALVPRTTPSILSEGRAWGAAAAKWHEEGETLLAPLRASEALRMSLDEDELEQRVAGFEVPAETRVTTEAHLQAMLEHYIATASPLYPLSRLEEEIMVPIPSRGHVRASTRYRFQCLIDGWTTSHGNPWLVEFKLRRRLSSAQLIVTSRQIRWYAWALRAATGINPVGVLVDERLNEAPKPARLVKAKRKGEGIGGYTISHAVDQLTTPGAYKLSCELYGVEPEPNTIAVLGQRQWHQRVPVMFRASELDEAGEELVSAAKLIRDLDSGELSPIRNVSPQTCPGCRYREICSNPDDSLFVDAQFLRTVPKRERPFEEETHDSVLRRAA